MPVGVVMYIRLLKPVPEEQITVIRDRFIEEFYDSLRCANFLDGDYPELIIPADKDGLLFVSQADREGPWLDLNSWHDYYGIGYERGRIDDYVQWAGWLEKAFHPCEIYYGHDGDDENHQLFNKALRDKYIEYYRHVGWEPYDTKDKARADELRKKYWTP